MSKIYSNSLWVISALDEQLWGGAALEMNSSLHLASGQTLAQGDSGASSPAGSPALNRLEAQTLDLILTCVRLELTRSLE
ncbi:MAG: hypothetical protein RBR69_07280 [Candidatus Cloacimonadaceae bacterium]|jgi:hypothetical protein|nr:hypothetical protein [Candidatus Cloacimonadota bacterium]MDY0127915.1 hypothetical protein [Candidatus Cloacimonadaceae bacterium]